MKTKGYAILFALAIIALIGVSCSESINGINDPETVTTDEKSTQMATLLGSGCTFSGTLTETDIAGLMEMREEEKLARDVYAYLYEMYSHIVFGNISKSEDAHTSAILYLINGYGLIDPTPEIVGEFSNEQFTNVYAQLTSEGSTGLIEALQVGALIEETDIADLEKLLETTENEDIVRVYSNLLEVSKSHLRSFTNVLAQLVETYVPQILSEELYQAILAESGNKGKHGNGTNSKGMQKNNSYGQGSSNTGMGYGDSQQNGNRNKNGNGKNS